MAHPLKLSRFNRAYESFCELVEVRNISSYREYQSNVLRFLNYLEQAGKSDLNLTPLELKEYYLYLKSSPSRRGQLLSDNTVNHHLFALKMFFDMLQKKNTVEFIPVFPKYIRTEIQHREILTQEEMKYIFSICKDNYEKSLLNLAYGCGLRRSEIENLNCNDVDLRNQILIVRVGKFDKRREIPLSDSVVNQLREYLTEDRHRRLKSKEKCISFLVNKIGRRPRGTTLVRQLQDILNRSSDEQLNKKHITLHCFRHSIATHLLDNGAPIQFVQEFLGHSTMDTSQLYTRNRKRKVQLQ